MSEPDLAQIFELRPRTRAGVTLIEDFVEQGEFSVVDVVEAWRAAAAVICGFYGITPRELLRVELWAEREIDDVASQEVQRALRRKLLETRCG